MCENGTRPEHRGGNSASRTPPDEPVRRPAGTGLRPGRPGPPLQLCLNWLQRKYAPTTTASAVKALLSIFQEDFVGGNIVAGIEEKIAANDALPDNHVHNLHVDRVSGACVVHRIRRELCFTIDGPYAVHSYMHFILCFFS